MATLIVIVATANHFWLDAVGGMACLAFGITLSYAWYGSLPHRLPKRVQRPGAGRLRALRRPPARAPELRRGAEPSQPGARGSDPAGD